MASYKKHFKKILQQRFPALSADYVAEIEVEFERLEPAVAFAKKPKNPMDKRMEFAAYFLAMIITLDKQGFGFALIRSIALEIANDYVQPKNALHAFWKRLPPKIISTRFGSWLVNYFKKKVSPKGHEDGFSVNILTDKAETLGFGYGVDILECGICKLFAKQGYQRFAPILCEVDYITTNLAGLTMTRTGTIANGAAKCDFRYQRKQGKQ